MTAESLFLFSGPKVHQNVQKRSNQIIKIAESLLHNLKTD